MAQGYEKQAFLSSSYLYRQQNPDYRGQQLDPSYANGPAENRPCTDVLCLVIFIAFMLAMIFVAYLGFTTGNPLLLASPFDHTGKQCKYDEGYQAYQKIFISGYLTDPSQITFVCVKDCPTNTSVSIQCKTNEQVTDCSLLHIYETTTVVNLCMPVADIDLQKFSSYLDLSILQECFSDLKQVWPVILAVVGFSFVYCLIFCLLMRFCAGCFIWTFIGFFILLEFCIGTLSFLLPFSEGLRKLIHYDQLPENLRDRDYQIVIAVLCWVIGLISFLIVCCMKKQIRISIGIIKAAADFTRQECIALVLPVYGTILQGLFLSLWVVVMLFLFSSNKQIEPIADTPFAWIVWNDNIRNFTIFYLFGLLWAMFFISGLTSYWVCSTVAIWYFQQGQPSWPICRSISRSFKSFGSIAFGSLVIAIVVSLKFAMEFLSQQLKQKTLGLDQSVGAAKFALKCASCCIACFQRAVRFLTENAYIMMAITGKNFCSSAQQSFYLMVRSASQYAISHGTTKVFIFMAKSCIVSLSALSGYMLVTQIEYFSSQVYSPVFITIIFVVASFPVAMAFMQFFQMTANTLLMCYCLEMDVLRGNNPRCPPALRRFLQDYVKAGSQIDGSYG